MFNVGGGEMVFLAILALLVFGPEGLPDIVKTVTRTVRAFRQAANDFQSEVNSALTLESEKRAVKERRRKRVVPVEERLQAVSNVEGAEELPPPLPASFQEAASEDLQPVSAANEPQTPAPLEDGEPEVLTALTGDAKPPSPSQQEDEDGPGLPMARPPRAVLAESDPTALEKAI
jgi:Tat protein translocase TatB subunit